VLRVLGAGGMGLVLEAEELTLKRRVALKVMKPSLAKHDIQRRRFLREAQATAAIEHPHIVTIFHVGEVGETPYLAMQLLKGESLDARLRRLASGGRQPPVDSVDSASGGRQPPVDLASGGRQPPVDLASGGRQPPVDLASGGRQPPVDLASGGRQPPVDSVDLARAGRQPPVDSAPEQDEQGANAPRSPKLPPLDESLRIGREIAEALAEAHERGLIHRDVKPSNIWLEAPRGWVKLVDFGLAYVGDDVHLTQSGTILGTPAYMSPEQARGETVDARGDLFSLGCVLYKLLTGRVPFQGPTTLAVLTALAVETPKSPSELEPSVPAPVSDLVMRLLAKRPDDRFESARAVALSIAELESVGWAPPTNVGQSVGWAPPTMAAKVAGAEPKRCPGGDGPVRGDMVAGAEPKRCPGGDAPARRRPRWPLVAAAAAACFLFAGIIVIVRDKEGREVARLSVPEGGGASILDDDAVASGGRKPPVDPATRPAAAGRPEQGADAAAPASRRTKDKHGANAPRSREQADTALRRRTKDKQGADAPRSPDLPTLADERAAAEWVLKAGGGVNQNQYSPEFTLPISDIRFNGGTAVTDDSLARLRQCPRLATLFLHGTPITDAGLEHLASLSALSHLALDGTRVSDDGLKHLTALARLQSLDLTDTFISDAGLLAHAGSFRELRSLTLMRTQITDAGLPALAALGRLDRLNLNETNVTDAGLAQLKPLANLRQLTLVGTEVNDAAIAALQPALPDCVITGRDGRVHPLHARDDDPDRAAAERFLAIGAGIAIYDEIGAPRDASAASLPPGPFRVTSVVLLDHSVGDAELELLGRLRQLERVHLDIPEASAAGLAHLSGLPKLDYLALTGATRLTDAALASLADLTQVRILALQFPWMTNAALKHLRTLTGLEQLHLPTCRINDAGLEHLKPLTDLRNLTLQATGVRGPGLRHLAALKQLSSLVLSATAVGDAGLSELAALPGLEDLRLRDATVSAEGLRRLRALPRLLDLNIYGVPNCGDDELEAVAALESLQRLSVSGPRITDAGVACLARLSNLRELMVSGAQLTDAGLAELHGLKRLKTLHLAGTAATEAGIAAFKAALPECQVTK